MTTIPSQLAWNQLSQGEQLRISQALTTKLPKAFSFLGIETHSMGNITQRVAMFSYRYADIDEAKFALILGGEISVGFDGKSWQPTDIELADWELTAEEYEIDLALAEYVDSVTTAPRTISIAPCLVEISVHSTLSQVLAEQGFRYPTADEWEYLCGAGSQTLFRWGDHAPCDRYPTDLEAEGLSDWNLHRKANAFGLHIAEDPYKVELVAEPHLTRGGDGGCAICGGDGFFMGWLTLASAYFEEHTCKHEPDEGSILEDVIGRRVFPLSFAEE